MPQQPWRDLLQASLNDWAVAEVRDEQARVVSAPLLDHFGRVLDSLGEPCSLTWGCDAQRPYLVRACLQLGEMRREGLAENADLQEARRLALADALRFFGLTLQEHWVEYDPEDGPNTAELLPGSEVRPSQDGYSGSYEAEGSALPDVPIDPQMEKARSHIDRLMETLREAGLGKQAAIVVARHGGYGQNVEESRAIYKELQALQKG